jgi:hypothetical protein
MRLFRPWRLGVLFGGALRLREIMAEGTDPPGHAPGTVTTSDPPDLLEQNEEDSETLYEYDPANEPPEFACRRDPTWRKVPYEACQELTGWYPPDTWWKHDTHVNWDWLGDKQDHLLTCITNAFEDAKSNHAWAR